MTLEEIRDKFCKTKQEEKRDPKYTEGYIDGVLDIYNELKRCKYGSKDTRPNKRSYRSKRRII